MLFNLPKNMDNDEYANVGGVIGKRVSNNSTIIIT